MFYSAVPQGTHENPKIVCRLRTHPAECSKLGKTQIIADAKRGMEEILEFCFKDLPPPVTFWNFTPAGSL